MSGWEPRGLWGGASQQGCGPYDLSSWALGSSGEALLRERQERNVPGRQTGLPEVLTGCHSFEVRVEEMWPVRRCGRLTLGSGAPSPASLAGSGEVLSVVSDAGSVVFKPRVTPGGWARTRGAQRGGGVRGGSLFSRRTNWGPRSSLDVSTATSCRSRCRGVFIPQASVALLSRDVPVGRSPCSSEGGDSGRPQGAPRDTPGATPAPRRRAL